MNSKQDGELIDSVTKANARIECGYPQSPGYKKPGTSKAAADSMRNKAPSLQQKVLDVLFHQDLTADECAAEIGKSLLSVRPRLTELLALGKIVDTGMTRSNDSGKQATVWRSV